MISPEHAVMVAKRLAPAAIIAGSLAIAGCSRSDLVSEGVYLITHATPRGVSAGLLFNDPNTDISRAVTVGVRQFEVFHGVTEGTTGTGRPISRYDERAFGLTVDENGLHGSLPIRRSP